ncbi:hypothetical protein RIF29_13998 [Crotalaria pallida]|uniref:Reticulon domain-containing protein n=1 Tax=Crotalaria pallida TaxID=3830 RepID=A0AAN9FGQ2_CROPI
MWMEFNTNTNLLNQNNSNNNNNNNNNNNRRDSNEAGKALIALVCGTLVYYHCAYRNSSIISLFSDVFIVLLCSLAILGLLFRQLNIQVPVDPLEWQISQDTANTIVASLANTIGATESVLRVAATGHDKRLFFKVALCLYVLSALGRFALGATIAYAGLCLFCLYMFAESSQSISSCVAWLLGRRNDTDDDDGEQDVIM